MHDRALLAIGQDRVQGRSLWNRAREAVEHEAVRGVGLLEPLGHNRDDEIVADERAALQRVADERADARAVLDGFPQHVAGGDFRDAVPRGKAVGLRTFARAGRPEEDQVERHGGYCRPSCDPRLRETAGRHGRAGHATESNPAAKIRQLNCSDFSY